MPNKNLTQAKKAKNDEFYTQLSDIEKELYHYRDFFRGKVVFCNCDDPEYSNFWKYFQMNFFFLGLKKLISTHYEPGKQSYKMEIVSADLPSGQLGIPDYVKTPLEGDGDFRSDECIEIFKEADVVVTNPPFSLFREYVSQLMEYEKKFIIIGNINAITYKEFFSLLRNNKVWVGTGFNLSMIFRSPYKNELESNRKFVQAKGYDPDYYIKTPAVCWYTNVDIQKRHTPMDLYMHYYGNEDHYPKYDNYDAINVDKTCEIPEDYDGVMGVPITFLDKYCPEQFEIVALGNSRDNFAPTKDYIEPVKHLKNGSECSGGAINCVLAIEVDTPPANTVYYTSKNSRYLVPPYARVLIRRRKSNEK